MPARGGNSDLTDDEVKRAVVFMANKAGANWTAPAVAAATAAGTAERTGQQVVEAVCAKCHATGVGGAPKIGDRAAWVQRVKLGLDKVYQSALKGHAGMPARGGMADLSDTEVKNAVEYMLNSGVRNSGGARAGRGGAAAAPAAAPAARVRADGKKVYDSGCIACHGAGIAGAPKFGDKAAWAPRIKTGMDALYAAALNGKGAMPPKGGNTTLPDADVKAAVDFMVANAEVNESRAKGVLAIRSPEECPHDRLGAARRRVARQLQRSAPITGRCASPTRLRASCQREQPSTGALRSVASAFTSHVRALLSESRSDGDRRASCLYRALGARAAPKPSRAKSLPGSKSRAEPLTRDCSARLWSRS